MSGGFYGEDVLSGVSSRLYSGYSRTSEQGNKAQLTGAEYNDDVRHSSESLDELVHRNIQEVLATVRGDEEERPYGDAASTATITTTAARTPPTLTTQNSSSTHRQQQAQKPAPPTSSRAPLSSSSRQPSFNTSSTTTTTTAAPPQRRLCTVGGASSRGTSGTNIPTANTSAAPRSGPPASSVRSTAPLMAPPHTSSPSRGTQQQQQQQQQPSLHDPYSSPGPNSSGLACSTLVQGPFPGGAAVSLDVPGNLEASLRLHKARIQGLEDDLMSMTRTAQDKDKLLMDALKEVKATRVEKATWSKEQKALQVQVERLKRSTGDAETALAARDVAVKELSVEGSRGEKARQAVEAEVKARDVRLQRALEEVERYKSLLSDARGQEREVKDVARSEYTRVVTENKRLERQRAELIVAFRKQLKLIDVLKRQRLHLEAGRALQFTEEEFLKMIDVS